MKFNLGDISQLIAGLSPFVGGVVQTIHVISALRAVGALTDDQVDADLEALIGEALAAKTEADLAASGSDPR